MNLLSSLFNKETTSEMCIVYEAKGMPKSVQMRLLDNLAVDSTEELQGGVLITFKSKGSFKAIQNGNDVTIELVDPGTPAFVFLEGIEAIAQPKGSGRQRVQTELGTGTVIKQTIS